MGRRGTELDVRETSLMLHAVILTGSLRWQ
jgi:hypothetical protein